MKARLFQWSILSIFALTACSDQTILDENSALNNKSWANKQETKFAVAIKDNSVPYHLYLNMRNSIKYPFSNISILVYQQNPSSKKHTYRVSFRVADREGLWLGKGVGNIFSHQVRFLKNYHFPDTGTYTFRIEHNMTLDPLPGVSDIGLRIQPANPTF